MREYNAVNKWNENWIAASCNKPQIRQLVIQRQGYNNERMYYVRARKLVNTKRSLYISVYMGVCACACVYGNMRPEHTYLRI